MEKLDNMQKQMQRDENSKDIKEILEIKTL